MIHRFALVSVLFASALAGAGGEPSVGSDTSRDRTVVLVALQDFAEWKGATFGDLKGVLAVSRSSEARTELTVERVKSIAPHIRAKIGDEVASSLVSRNRQAVSVSDLVIDSLWAQLLPENHETDYFRDPPQGAKAVGNITLPGFSADGKQALMQVHHTWSMHGAVITYLLVNEKGRWKVVARDQTVYL